MSSPLVAGKWSDAGTWDDTSVWSDIAASIITPITRLITLLANKRLIALVRGTTRIVTIK